MGYKVRHEMRQHGRTTYIIVTVFVRFAPVSSSSGIVNAAPSFLVAWAAGRYFGCLGGFWRLQLYLAMLDLHAAHPNASALYRRWQWLRAPWSWQGRVRRVRGAALVTRFRVDADGLGQGHEK